MYGVFATVTGTLVKVVASEAVKQAIRLTQRRFALALQDRRDAARLTEFLRMPGLDGYDYDLPMSHPVLGKFGPHPDDLTAFLSLVGPQLRSTSRRLQYVSSLTRDPRNGIVLIGSPEVSPLLRLACGYRKSPDLRGYSYVSSTVDLPFIWREEADAVRAKSNRYVPGIGLVTRPNWRVQGPDREYIPALGRDDFPMNDYLVLTVMPNFLDRIALDSGRRIISIAGLRGIGTAAVRLTLRNKKLLAEIYRNLPNNPTGFQALIEAKKINHSERAGSHATRVELLGVEQVHPIGGNWNYAFEAVKNSFNDWVAEQDVRQSPPPPAQGEIR